MADEQWSGNLETAKAERPVWLMKCPLLVAKAWKAHPADAPHPVAKVVVSVDPLKPPDESSSIQVSEFSLPFF